VATLFTPSLAILANPADWSAAVIPSVGYSTSNNLTLALTAMLFTGRHTDEYPNIGQLAYFKVQWNFLNEIILIFFYSSFPNHYPGYVVGMATNNAVKAYKFQVRFGAFNRFANGLLESIEVAALKFNAHLLVVVVLAELLAGHIEVQGVQDLYGSVQLLLR